MHAVIDRRLIRIGNAVIVAIAITLASIMITVAQMATAANAAAAPQKDQAVLVELTLPAVTPNAKAAAFRGSLR